ncbi:MAG: glycosyltransferase family 39 protein [bacterium]
MGLPQSLKNRKLFIIALGLFSFILLFTFKAEYQTADSIGYAYSIKTGTGLFHPHHLLYNPVVRILFLLTSRIIEPGNAVFPGQIYNILWAIVTVMASFILIQRLFNSPIFGLLFAVFLLVSRGIWEIATQNTVYLPAIGSLVLLVTVMAAFADTEQTIKKNIILSLLLALAILNHQINVLFCIPLAYYLFVTNRKFRIRNMVLVLLLAAIIVFLTYFLLFIITKPNWTFAKFYRYCFLYATYPQPDWGTFTHFGHTGVYHFLRSQVWNLVVISDRFQSNAAAIFGVILTGIVIWNIMRIYRHAVLSQFRIMLLIWLGVYSIFFLWWLPTYTHPLVITLFPIVCLGYIAIKDFAEFGTKLKLNTKIIGEIVLGIIIIIMVVNLNQAILPLHRSKGALYQEAVKLDALVPKTSVIFTDYTVREYLRYYFNRENAFAAEVPMLDFYQTRHFTREYLTEKDECLIPLSNVIPTYQCTKFTGYTNPHEWRKYIEWLFDCQYDAEHKLVNCHQFKLIIAPDGTPYLDLSSSKIELHGLSELFLMLDKQIIDSYHLGTNPFQSWLNTTLPKP